MTKRSKHRFLLADSLILIACVTLSTNVRKFSLRFQGTNIFNSLSSEIQNASSTAKHTLALLMLVCSFSLFFLVYSCIIFSHLFFLVFALTRSAFSIFILFNDYFLCSKQIVRTLI